MEFDMESLFAWSTQLNFPMTKNINSVWISAKSAVREWIKQYGDCIVEVYGPESPERPTGIECKPDRK